MRHVCPGCGNKFEGRADAKTCSDRCKKAVLRSGGDPMAAAYDGIIAKIDALAAGTDKGRITQMMVDLREYVDLVIEDVAKGDEQTT